MEKNLIRAPAAPVPLLLLSVALLCAAWPRMAGAQESREPIDESWLDEARSAFRAQGYSDVVAMLRRLLLPVPPAALRVDDVTSGLTYLGVSAYYVGEDEIADEAFRVLLTLRPGYRLDPLLYPQDVRVQFERVREQLFPAGPQAHADMPQQGLLYLETRVVTQSPLVSVLPLGYGFFSAGRDAAGLLHLFGQLLTAATSASLYVINETSRDRRGYYADPQAASTRRAWQVGLGWTFYALVGVNVLHGALAHPSFARQEVRVLADPPEGAEGR